MLIFFRYLWLSYRYKQLRELVSYWQDVRYIANNDVPNNFYQIEGLRFEVIMS